MQRLLDNLTLKCVLCINANPEAQTFVPFAEMQGSWKQTHGMT